MPLCKGVDSSSNRCRGSLPFLEAIELQSSPMQAILYLLMFRKTLTKHHTNVGSVYRISDDFSLGFLDHTKHVRRVFHVWFFLFYQCNWLHSQDNVPHKRHQICSESGLYLWSKQSFSIAMS